MKQSFEEFLMFYHAENYPTLDDLLPEAYADWISEVDPDTIIELAEKWHKEQLKQAYLQGAKDMKEAVEIDYSDAETDIAEGFNDCLYEIDQKAQQFIDSLEK